MNQYEGRTKEAERVTNGKARELPQVSACSAVVQFLGMFGRPIVPVSAV